MIGWHDSTVVGISEWSPASGERVGGCLPSKCISDIQGMSYLMVHTDMLLHALYTL